MSRVQPSDGATVEATPRKRLTPSERVTILDRQNGKCCACPTPLVITIESATVLAPMIDEHILPLELGGSNDLSNRELRCVPCAKAKTRDDIRRIAKMRRQKAKYETPRADWPKTQKLSGRGFRSRWAP